MGDQESRSRRDLAGPEHLGHEKAFTRSVVKTGVIERVRKSMYYVETPNGGGTAFVMSSATDNRAYGLATAAHVVRGAEAIRVRLEGTDEFLPAEVVTVRPDLKSEPDVAILRLQCSEPTPEDRRRPYPSGKDKSELVMLPPGAEVVYGGYPVQPGFDGSHPAMFAHGMVSGYHRIGREDGLRYPIYIIDGMGNPGLSGGPVFCPATGAVLGIILGGRLPRMDHSGHGWVHALPIGVAGADLDRIIEAGILHAKE